MESQIKQLKLSATNIKGTLIRGNKELKKLRVKERNLFNRQRISAKRLQKENFTEGKGSGSGVGGYLKQKALAPTMSIIDSLKEFAGNILLGILINTLPTAIKKVEQFLEDNKDIIKTVKDVITSTGSALEILVNIFKGPNAPDPTKLEEDNKELKKLAKEFEPGGRFEKEIDGLEKDVTSLNTDLRKEFRDLYTERTSEQVKEDVVETIKQRSTSGSPITRKEFTSKANQYARAKTSKGQRTPLINIPGIGSYQRVPSEGIGGWFGGSKEITKDISGNEIDPKEFDKRYNDIIKSQNEIFESLKSEGVEGYSSGGLVSKRGPSRSQNLTRQGQSAEEKIAMRQFGSFLNLKDSVIKESKLLETSEKSQEEMKKALRDLKKYLELTKPELPKSSMFTLPSSEHSGPTSPLPGTGSLSSPMIDATGEPGVDFTPAGSNNRAVFAGEVVEIGHQYNSSKIGGDGRMGSGYGNYVVIRSQDPNNSGKYFDGLYAHFPDGEIKVSPGQKVEKGQVLGRMATAAEYENPKTRPRVGSGTGAHTSLDFLNPGSKKPYSNWKGLVPLVDPSFSSSNVKPKGHGKDGGGSNLLQSFDTGSEVVMIMAQQPVIVPGPTRYITRTRTQTMPVPVQIAPKSSGLRSLV